MRTHLPLLCLALVLAAPLRADYRTLDTSPEQDQVLAGVLERAVAGKVVLLDLDSTLLDTRPRQVAILRAWAARSGKTELEGLCVEHFQSWDFFETLKRAGVPIQDIPALEKEVKAAWRQDFWREDQLAHDLSLPGAASFARALHAKGATLVYFGRRASQERGTRATLTRLGFPLDERAVLGLDVIAHEEGESRKDRRQAELDARTKVLTDAAAKGEVVAAFDNDGNSIDALRTRFPEASVIHLRTDGPGFTQTKGPWAQGFLRTSDKVSVPGSNPDVPLPETALEVVDVSDGDTVKARTPEGETLTLRLIGIDTPEKDPLYDRPSMADKRARHVTGYGKRVVEDKNAWKEAKVFLQGLLAKGKLHLEYDAANDKSGHRDSTSSRRVLAYLFVVTPEGERIDVNAELCRQGYTLDYGFRYPHKRAEEFRTLIKEAKEHKRGYWSPNWQPL